MRHVNRTIVAQNFGEIRQGTAVIQMKMRDDYAIKNRVEIASFGQLGLPLVSINVLEFGGCQYIVKVGPSAFVIVGHVHPTVQHNVLSAYREDNATSAHILAGCFKKQAPHAQALVSLSSSEFDNIQLCIRGNDVC
jgi:hypothetical protein